MLAGLAHASGVRLIGCTGFHLPRYYPPEDGLWQLDAQAACDRFAGELLKGMRETLGFTGRRAGAGRFYQDRLPGRASPIAAGPAGRGCPCGAPDRRGGNGSHRSGRDAESILRFFVDQGLSAYKPAICHIDKCADFGLHRELASEGALLAI